MYDLDLLFIIMLLDISRIRGDGFGCLLGDGLASSATLSVHSKLCLFL